MSATLRAAVLAAVLGLCACQSPPTHCAGAVQSDPIRPVNKGVYWFNEGFDRGLFEPIAKGWDWITNDYARSHVDQFYRHWFFPKRFLNHALQGQPRKSGVELGRFLINTVGGVAGIWDPAGHFWDIQRAPADTGQTFGRWRLAPGPFLMLPILGPSGPRDGVGALLDMAMTPLVLVPFASVPDFVNRRAMALDSIRQIRENSLDLYVAYKDGWGQLRCRAVAWEIVEPEQPPEDDLYFIDEEEDEE